MDIRISQYIRNIQESHKFHRKSYREQGSERQTRAEVRIQSVIFQEDSLSPLLFVIAIMQLNHKIKNTNETTNLPSQSKKINYLIYLDYIKVFATKVKEVVTLIETMRFGFFVWWHINLGRLLNAKTILQEEQYSWEDKGVHTIPKRICPKVNVIARLEFELTY